MTIVSAEQDERLRRTLSRAEKKETAAERLLESKDMKHL
jgi:hypothetical protein